MEFSHDQPTVWNCGRFSFDWVKKPYPIVMGILNVTPNSFSDGGKFFDRSRALEHAYQMIEDGAQIIDIGGESTQPGVEPISVEEELDRVLPILEALQNSGVALSIDTYKGQTMQKALEVGVDILNDIRGFLDPLNVSVAKSHPNVGICIMHMQNNPQTMQIKPNYENVILEVGDFLEQRVDSLVREGISRTRIAIDPGFGFGKSVQHNLTLLNRLNTLPVNGTTLLVGLSRKKTLSKILDKPTDQLMLPSVVAAILAIERGAKVVRVHDVKPTIEGIKVWRAMQTEDLV
jgi:dihydropteroate synthase